MNTRASTRPSNLAHLAPLLQSAKDHFAIGICLKADHDVAAAIEIMVEHFAPNNPQLADAYTLRGDICREVVKSFWGDQLKAEYTQHWLTAVRAEIACRMQACESESLARARYLYGRTLALQGDSRGFSEIAESMAILSRLVNGGKELKPLWFSIV